MSHHLGDALSIHVEFGFQLVLTVVISVAACVGGGGTPGARLVGVVEASAASSTRTTPRESVAPLISAPTRRVQDLRTTLGFTRAGYAHNVRGNKTGESSVSQNLVLTVIGAAVGVGLVAVIAYQVARFMRGSITLSLRRSVFNSGDTITGSFELHTKKAIQGNQLSVSLIGVQVTTSYDGGKERTRSREIYRNEVVLEEEKAYPAGHTAGYDFQLVVPNANAPEFLNSPLGQALSAAVHLLSNSGSQLKWKVEARLDAQGVDLAAAQSVSINTGQLL